MALGPERVVVFPWVAWTDTCMCASCFSYFVTERELDVDCDESSVFCTSTLSFYYLIVTAVMKRLMISRVSLVPRSYKTIRATKQGVSELIVVSTWCVSTGG